jgi:hypothetical protein
LALRLIGNSPYDTWSAVVTLFDSAENPMMHFMAERNTQQHARLAIAG